ncbi:hypothetical protein RB195_019344 [Necator americanus]|uniref:Uncharacterized protein n=1 Tax=Necator americanus TaxID=51031 RepID=A0ABR1CFC9_NECAM
MKIALKCFNCTNWLGINRQCELDLTKDLRNGHSRASRRVGDRDGDQQPALTDHTEEQLRSVSCRRPIKTPEPPNLVPVRECVKRRSKVQGPRKAIPEFEKY